MDVFVEPVPWPDRARDPHLLYAAGLLLFTGYLGFVLVHAITGPVTPWTATADREARVPVRLAAPPEPEPATKAAARNEPADTERPPRATTESPAAPETAAPTARPRIAAAESERSNARASDGPPRPIDLTIPRRESALTMPPVCRAGPCAPGTEPPPRVRVKRRPADEVLADLDPEVLEGLDLEALGIDPDLGDIFGERRQAVSRNCELVQPDDNVVTRQMGMPQFLRCRRSTESEARARALLEALRDKRPDLFEDR